MADGPFFHFLDRAFASISDEAPAAYRVLVRQLEPLRLQLEVDGETRWLCCRPAPSLSLAVNGHVDAELRTNRALIVRLIDGEATLLEAIRQDQLFLRGSPGGVIAAHDALLSFFGGAARAPSVPRLLRAYLDCV